MIHLVCNPDIMADNYLSKLPRDLDKDLKLFTFFATSPIVKVYAREMESDIKYLPSCAVIIVEIRAYGNLKGSYVIKKANGRLDKFLIGITTEKRVGVMPYLILDPDERSGVAFAYDNKTQILIVVIDRPGDIFNSRIVNTIPKNVTQTVIHKLTEVLLEYNTLRLVIEERTKRI